MATSAWAEYEIGIRCSEIIKDDTSDEHWILIDKQSERVRHFILARFKSLDGTYPTDMSSILINNIISTEDSKYYVWETMGDISYTWRLNRENLELSGSYRTGNLWDYADKSACILSTVEQVKSGIGSIYLEERRKEKEDREQQERKEAKQMIKNKI